MVSSNQAAMRVWLDTPNRYLDMSNKDVAKLPGDQKGFAEMVRSPSLSPLYRTMAGMSASDVDKLVTMGSVVIDLSASPSDTRQALAGRLGVGNDNPTDP